ncbi:hypothetical protein ACRRTK_012578 [Alexandromys fortis]
MISRMCFSPENQGLSQKAQVHLGGEGPLPSHLTLISHGSSSALGFQDKVMLP